MALAAGEGGAEKLFAEDEIHPDDDPGKSEDPSDAGMATLRMGAAVMAMDLNGAGINVAAMLQLSGVGADKILVLKTSHESTTFNVRDFKPMSMAMGNKQQDDTLKLSFRPPDDLEATHIELKVL